MSEFLRNLWGFIAETWPGFVAGCGAALVIWIVWQVAS